MTFTVITEDFEGGHPTVETVDLAGLPPRIREAFATQPVSSSLDAYVPLAGEFDESKHPRDHGKFTDKGGSDEPQQGDAPHLTVKNYEGRVGDKSHLTRTEEGTVPTSVIANLPGVMGEQPGAHGARGRQGAEWDQFLNDVRENGIRQPIFITVDHGAEPKISEGNTRRDAAVELGLKNVPVEIRYFGHAEQQGSVVERANGRQASAVYWPSAVTLDFNEEDHPRDNKGEFAPKGGDDTSSSSASTSAKVFGTQRETRDMLIEQRRSLFLTQLGDYPSRVQEAVAARAEGKQNVDTPQPENRAQEAYYRTEVSSRWLGPPKESWDRYDANMVKGFVQGDKTALAALRGAASRELSRDYNLDSVRPAFTAQVRAATDQWNTDPRIAALQDKYGAPDITVAATAPGRSLDSLDTPSATTTWDGNTIRVYDNAWLRPDPSATLPDQQQGTIPTIERSPLQPGSATVGSGSMTGVLDHEFGHSVYFHMSDAQRSEFNGLYDARKQQYDTDFAKATDYASRDAVANRAVSYYAMNSGRPGDGDRHEGFAEMFAAVVHPDYKRDLYDPSNHDLLKFMEGIVKGG